MRKSVKSLVLGGGWAPFTGCAAHIDFTRQKYYWARGLHSPTEFATFTSPVFKTGGADAGLTPTSSTSITILLATLGVSAPYCMAAVYYPTSVPAADRNILRHRFDATNFTGFDQKTDTTARFINTAAGVGDVTTISVTEVVNTRHAIAGSVETNNYVGSCDGAAMANSPDTTVAVISSGTIWFGRGAGASSEIVGSLRHAIFWSGAKTIAELNAITAKARLI